MIALQYTLFALLMTFLAGGPFWLIALTERSRR